MQRKFLCAMVILMMVLTIASGASAADTDPIADTYRYSTRHKYYVQPAVLDGWAEKDALTTTTADGAFFCFTGDRDQADAFVNAQRTLMRCLSAFGVEAGEMTFYCTDYGYSFSDSAAQAVYVDLADMHSWQQVLVTLQGIWGDYTEYGYVYSMANTIAAQLEWRTDPAPAVDHAALKSFLAENPEAIHLLYPAFTTSFASEETVSNSKALARFLFDELQWQAVIADPVEMQLDAYYSLVAAYAQENAIPFSRQACGYAYYGENIKLRIMTEYAELLIDSNYRDTMPLVYGDYWSDYSSIYATANAINEEISAAVAYFGLEGEAGMMRIKWCDSQNSLTKKYVTGNTGAYYASTHIAYITSIQAYLHEYHHHIEYCLKKENEVIWQSQAFCELGASHSRYARLPMERHFSELEPGRSLFQALTGRAFQSGRADYYEAFDVMCFTGQYYELNYRTGAEALNSFSWYLTGLYGERTVYDLMLYPEQVQEVTGKTWELLRAEWEQMIRSKYETADIPFYLQ